MLVRQKLWHAFLATLFVKFSDNDVVSSIHFHCLKTLCFVTLNKNLFILLLLAIWVFQFGIILSSELMNIFVYIELCAYVCISVAVFLEVESQDVPVVSFTSCQNIFQNICISFHTTHMPIPEYSTFCHLSSSVKCHKTLDVCQSVWYIHGCLYVVGLHYKLYLSLN